MRNSKKNTQAKMKMQLKTSVTHFENYGKNLTCNIDQVEKKIKTHIKVNQSKKQNKTIDYSMETLKAK